VKINPNVGFDSHDDLYFGGTSLEQTGIQTVTEQGMNAASIV
jgi:hypothetical protein